jgi:outer membrane lipoprotein-sorting protein
MGAEPVGRKHMRSRRGLAGIGAGLACLVATSLCANAQSVPLPVPAPHSKMRLTKPSTPKPSKPLAANAHRLAQVTGAAAPAPSPQPQPPSIGVVRSGGPPFDANQRALVERANAYLSGLNALVGNFVQIASDGGRTEGKFYLQKPGRVRFEYNPPSPVELIADGSSIAVRDRKLNTQEIIPLSQTPLRFLVADRIDLFKDTNVVGISSDDTFATVVIEERQTFAGTHRLMLMFGARDFQLRQWTVTDPQGFDTTVALYNLDPKQKPDPSLFKIDYTRYIQ